MLESLKQFNGQLGDGSTLAQNIDKLSPKAISRGIENYYQNMRLGIGRGVHKGKGWNSHGETEITALCALSHELWARPEHELAFTTASELVCRTLSWFVRAQKASCPKWS